MHSLSRDSNVHPCTHVVGCLAGDRQPVDRTHRVPYRERPKHLATHSRSCGTSQGCGSSGPSAARRVLSAAPAAAKQAPGALRQGHPKLLRSSSIEQVAAAGCEGEFSHDGGALAWVCRALEWHGVCCALKFATPIVLALAQRFLMHLCYLMHTYASAVGPRS